MKHDANNYIIEHMYRKYLFFKATKLENYKHESKNCNQCITNWKI